MAQFGGISNLHFTTDAAAYLTHPQILTESKDNPLEFKQLFEQFYKTESLKHNIC